MKKLRILSVVMVLLLFVVSTALAVETRVITRDVTIKGDSVRGPLVTGLVNSYFSDTKGVTVENTTLGEYVEVVGPGGTEKIHFSPKLVAILQKLSVNSHAGEGLMSICPTQAGQLQKAIGPMRATIEPLIEFEQISICQQKGGCYNGKVLTGSYQTLQPYKGIRVVLNNNNPLYPKNSIRFKVEAHYSGHIGWPNGTGWGPTIILCNITMETPIRLIDTNASLILPYLERITVLKKGKPFVEDGDSCWEVVIRRDGSIFSNDSPAEARFFKE